MTEVQHVTEVAKGISDYGMMAVSAAFFLLLSAAMMIALFKWFKSMINRLLEQQECLNQLLDTVQDNVSLQRNLMEDFKLKTYFVCGNLMGSPFTLVSKQVGS